MTAPPQPADGRPAAGPAVAERASAFRIGLNLAGVVIVGWSILGPGGDRPSPLAIGTTVVALAGWAVPVLRPAALIQDALLMVTVLAGSLGVGGTHGILVTAVAAAIIPFASRPERQLTASVAPAAGGGALIAISAVLSRQCVECLVAVASGLVVAVLVGVTRRQNRIAERRER